MLGVRALVSSFLLLLSGTFLLSEAINFCPEKCNCDDEKLVVTCIRADLEYMPNTLNPGLRTIVYKYNRFPTVDVSLNFLTKLVKIDLSHNHIVSVTKRAFSSQKDLIDLNLENNKVNQINNMTFYGLSNLQVLNFRSNNVEALRGQPFLFAKKLQKINFARNRISHLDNTSFLDLPDLRILNLENNLLQAVPTEAFKPLVDLAELYLSGNPLISLPNGAFSSFRSLTALDLSSCRLSNIFEASFKGLGTLRKLKLSDNELKALPPTALRDNLPNLEELYVGMNPYSSLTASSGLTGIKRLKILDISGCGKLRSIGPKALFGSSAHLERLVISENRHLNSISENVFGDEGVTHLRHLDLAENGLRRLGEALLPNWTKLKVIDLTGNPWQCDCQSVFIYMIVKRLLASRSGENIPDVVASTKCASPRRYNGKPVYLLQMTELASEEDGGDCYNSLPASSSSDADYDFLGEESSAASGSSNSSSLSPPEETLIVIISVASVLSLLLACILCFALYKCSRGNRSRKATSFFSDWFFKEYRWKAGSASPDSSHHHRDYAKTPYDDDFFFHHNAQNYQYSTGGRSIPVTEL
eukprot:TRINITY_DN2874_c0_g1_i1.p1 TRINITY_DN2874_c0_g1~~TRINITY_DN2874_c0_g1_i1.p1  ORF type:complete len:586 (+),score=164.90 TRINITY_DN2874_c0_g1_i1:244-2001(+)